VSRHGPRRPATSSSYPGVPHSYDVVRGPARKLIIAVPGGIEDFFDDLVNGVDPATITHRHGVRFLH
jgi:hypothetical protein